MFEFTPFLAGLMIILTAATATWMLSLSLRDVSIVDSMWSIFFLLATVAYVVFGTESGPRTTLVLVLVAVWALRLAIFLTWRNWGESEDRRYVAIRQRNEPGFALKSLYLVFGLQGLLAWVISLPLLTAVSGPYPIGTLDYIGVALWTLGFFFESVGDYQLARFKSDPRNAGMVMDSGLWRYTRHPNYFGDFCVWWGFYLIALSAGGWWTIIAPLLMSWLLLKVSGVTLLEQDIGNRRPRYADYIARTNAFFPGPRATSDRRRESRA